MKQPSKIKRKGITPANEAHLWKKATSQKGRVYYYHTVSRLVQWDKPWKEAIAKVTDRTYYYHPITREVVWELPPGARFTPTESGSHSKKSKHAQHAGTNHDAGAITLSTLNTIDERISLNTMPLDILVYIFNHLGRLPANGDEKAPRAASHSGVTGHTTLALHVPLVCRSFMAACKAAITIDIGTRLTGGISGVGLMALATRRFRAVKGLNIVKDTNLIAADVEMVLTTMAGSPDTRHALSNLQIAKIITQPGQHPSKSVQAIGRFVNLVHLNLRGTLLADEGIQQIAATVKSITTLDVRNCYLLTDNALTFIGMLWPQLEHLDISKNSFSADSLEPIGSGCPHLESVSFNSCRGIGDESLGFLADGCKELVKVSMFQTNCTDDGIAALVRGCPNLDPDNIGSRWDDADEAVNRTEIKGDQTLMAVGDNRPNLTSFHIQNAHHVTGVGLAALAAGCKNITSLMIQDCAQITDADFATTVQNFPLISFNELNLGYSDDWIDEDERGDNYLIAVASVHGASVASVDDIGLASALNVSDVGLSHIIRECTTAFASFEKDIRPLIDQYQKYWESDEELYYIIGDLSCIAIAERFPDVSDLCLKGCSGVTDAGLLAIANTCTSITYIDLTGANVTVAGLVPLSEGCKSIEHFTGLFDDFADADYAAIVRAFHFVPPSGLNLHDTSWVGHWDKEDTRGDAYLTALLSIHGPTFPSLDAINDLSEEFGYNLTDVGVSRIIQECTLIVETFGDVEDLISIMSKEIFLDDCFGDCFGDSCASAVGSRFPDLLELNLAKYNQVSDIGLTSLAGLCKNLIAATLSCESITSAGLQTLGRECTQISSLVLTGWSAFEDADWATIVRSFPSVAIDKMFLYPDAFEQSNCSDDSRGAEYRAAIIATHGEPL